jgi:hypothetical protein
MLRLSVYLATPFKVIRLKKKLITVFNDRINGFHTFTQAEVSAAPGTDLQQSPFCLQAA